MLRKKIDGLLLRQNKRRAIVELFPTGKAETNGKPDRLHSGWAFSFGGYREGREDREGNF